MESPAVPRLPPLPLPCAESSSPPPAANPPPSGDRFLVPHVRAPPLTLRDPPGRPVVPPAARVLPAPPRPERPRGCSPLRPGCSWPRGCGAASGPPRRSQLRGFPGAPGPGGARPVLLGAAGAAAPPAGPGASLQPRRCRCLRGPSPARRAPRCSSRPGPAAARRLRYRRDGGCSLPPSFPSHGPGSHGRPFTGKSLLRRRRASRRPLSSAIEVGAERQDRGNGRRVAPRE